MVQFIPKVLSSIMKLLANKSEIMSMVCKDFTMSLKIFI